MLGWCFSNKITSHLWDRLHGPTVCPWKKDVLFPSTLTPGDLLSLFPLKKPVGVYIRNSSAVWNEEGCPVKKPGNARGEGHLTSRSNWMPAPRPKDLLNDLIMLLRLKYWQKDTSQSCSEANRRGGHADYVMEKMAHTFSSHTSKSKLAPWGQIVWFWWWRLHIVKVFM